MKQRTVKMIQSIDPISGEFSTPPEHQIGPYVLDEKCSCGNENWVSKKINMSGAPLHHNKDYNLMQISVCSVCEAAQMWRHEKIHNLRNK